MSVLADRTFAELEMLCVNVVQRCWPCIIVLSCLTECLARQWNTCVLVVSHLEPVRYSAYLVLITITCERWLRSSVDESPEHSDASAFHFTASVVRGRSISRTLNLTFSTPTMHSVNISHRTIPHSLPSQTTDVKYNHRANKTPS
jgi:hypothetical protein